MAGTQNKVLIIGTGPLLDKGVKKIGGQCLRTWHFTKPIMDAGYEINLLTIPIPDKDNPPSNTKISEEKDYSGFKYISFLKNNPDEIVPVIQKIHDAFKPDVILGINTFPSYIACLLKSQKPLWVDLNGWCMVEGQTKAYLDKNDDILKYFWKLERRICLRADKFSAVSEPQRLALIGELAAIGRLNSYTFNWKFAESIPNAANELHLNFPLAPPKNILRGVKIPGDAFAVLWSGGFNTWTDVKALPEIINEFLKSDKKNYFISTGGMVDGHDEKTYQSFLKLIEKSEFKERCIIEGWIETEKMLHYYAECDIGINLDSDNYETLFGARNRITNMLASGLPVLTTRGSEISIMLESSGAGWNVPIGDNAAFVNKLKEFSKQIEFARKEGSDGEKFVSIRTKARQWAIEMFKYEKTIKCVLEWLKNPVCAPDNQERYRRCCAGILHTKLAGANNPCANAESGNSRNEIVQNPLENTLNPLEKESVFIENYDIEHLLANTRDLNIIRNKPIYKAMKKIKKYLKCL